MSNVLDKSFIHRSYPKLAYGSIYIYFESLLMSSVHMPEKCIMQKRPLIVSLNYTSTLLLIRVIDFKIQNLYLYCQILQCHYPPPHPTSNLDHSL